MLGITVPTSRGIVNKERKKNDISNIKQIPCLFCRFTNDTVGGNVDSYRHSIVSGPDTLCLSSEDHQKLF